MDGVQDLSRNYLQIQGLSGKRLQKPDVEQGAGLTTARAEWSEAQGGPLLQGPDHTAGGGLA